jgi:hypothetical protein
MKKEPLGVLRLFKAEEVSEEESYRGGSSYPPIF